MVSGRSVVNYPVVKLMITENLTHPHWSEDKALYILLICFDWEYHVCIWTHEPSNHPQNKNQTWTMIMRALVLMTGDSKTYKRLRYRYTQIDVPYFSLYFRKWCQDFNLCVNMRVKFCAVVRASMEVVTIDSKGYSSAMTCSLPCPTTRVRLSWNFLNTDRGPCAGIIWSGFICQQNNRWLRANKPCTIWSMDYLSLSISNYWATICISIQHT